MRVDFYMGPEFVRTKGKTNPFFDPLIRVCQDNGLEWRVILPNRNIVCGYDRAHIESSEAINFIHTWVWRASRICWFGASWKVRYLAGLVVKSLFRSRFRADVAIVIAGGAECSLYWSIKAKRIVDLQHGVIYSKHRGYFDSIGRFLGGVDMHSLPNREFWVYGQGYADCFFKHPDNAKDLQGRVKVIGDVVRAGEKKEFQSAQNTGDVVVFSLQLTADLSREEMVASVKKMEEFFTDFFRHFGNKYVCYVKQHPRFNNVYDLSSFYAKFPHVKETLMQWTELYDRMALHVTFNSTVTFDCASRGIPTLLLDLPDAHILNRSFYRDDYGYPYYDKTVSQILDLRPEESRSTILAWYHYFYAPFTEETCRRLLKGEI